MSERPDPNARPQPGAPANYEADVAAWVVRLSEPIIKEMGAGAAASRFATGPAAGAVAGFRAPNRELIHGLVDASADRAATAGKVMRNVLQELRRMVAGRGATWPFVTGPTPGGIAALVVSSVLPGERRRLVVQADTLAAVALVGVKLSCSDLMAPGAAAIPAGAVIFDPETIDVDPGKTIDVVLHLEVPRATRPGTYAGLVAAEGVSAALAVLTVTVL